MGGPSLGRVRAALAALLVVALVLIWTTNKVLTQRFSESSRVELELQMALFAGNLRSELERQHVVPLLLARDPALTGALAAQDFSQSSRRLIEFREDIGAANLRLFDMSGKVVASTDRNDLGATQRNAPYFIDAMRSNTTVFSAVRDELDRNAFYYSRRIDQGGHPAWGDRGRGQFAEIPAPLGRAGGCGGAV